MALEVLQQRIFGVDAQTVLLDEPPDGFLLRDVGMILQLHLDVVVELPVEKSLQLTVDQTGMAGRDVVPVAGILGHASLLTALGKMDEQVAFRGVHAAPHTDMPTLQRPLRHRLPHTVVETEGVGDDDASRLGCHVKLHPGIFRQIRFHADGGHTTDGDLMLHRLFLFEDLPVNNVAKIIFFFLIRGFSADFSVFCVNSRTNHSEMPCLSAFREVCHITLRPVKRFVSRHPFCKWPDRP